MSMSAQEFAGRLDESFVWWTNNRDLPSDIEKRIQVCHKGINDLYSLMSHAAELFASLEDRVPGSHLWRPRALQHSGDLRKLG